MLKSHRWLRLDREVQDERRFASRLKGNPYSKKDSGKQSSKQIKKGKKKPLELNKNMQKNRNGNWNQKGRSRGRSEASPSEFQSLSKL